MRVLTLPIAVVADTPSANINIFSISLGSTATVEAQAEAEADALIDDSVSTRPLFQHVQVQLQVLTSPPGFRAITPWVKPRPPPFFTPEEFRVN
jgi:hypothetical protein